jgi:cytochrome c556
MHVKLIVPLALAIGLSACSGPVEDTRPGQPVKTRQTAFKEMLRVFEPMGTMLRDGKYDAVKFEAMAAELITKRNGPWGHFGPDTNYPPTKARPEVWTKQAELEKARQAFIQSTDALLIAAKANELKSVTDAYSKVYDHCQSCHQEFKKK